MARRPAEKKTIPLAALILDEQNPRLDLQVTQRASIKAMIHNQKQKIVLLAEDIHENGLSDAERFMVMRSAVNPELYISLDGNRRLVALMLLTDPSLLSGELTPKLRERLNIAATAFQKKPITEVDIALYDDRVHASSWVSRRHSADMKGVGQETWKAKEKQRFDARLDGGKKRKVEWQVLEFIISHGSLTTTEQDQLEALPISTLRRIITDKYVQEVIGYSVKSESVQTSLADSEILKPFKAIAFDLTNPDKSERIYVPDVEKTTDRAEYIESFTSDELPSPDAPQVMPHTLGEVNVPLPKSEKGKSTENGDGKPKGAGGSADGTGQKEKDKAEDKNKEKTGDKESSSGTKSTDKDKKRASHKRKKSSNERVHIIPEDCHLTISSQRIHDIYEELQKELDSDRCSNAAAVLLRVFVELSLDNFIKRKSIPVRSDKGAAKLSDKLHIAGRYMVDNGLITKAQAEPIYAAALKDAILAPTILQMHTFVHQENSNPVGVTLRKHWNNLQLLMETIWSE